MKITIGADPELFLLKNGSPVSAFGMIPGNKKAPHKVDNGAVQVDGMALEFNINPSETVDQFNNNIDSVLKTLRGMVPSDYEFNFDASVTFDSEHFNSQPKEAVVIGCDPDYDPYRHREYPAPMDNNSTTRAAGGHIHVGWGTDFDIHNSAHIAACEKMAIVMDYFLGLPALVLDSSPASDARFCSYGRAGAYRPKPYGVEYRFLSNFWVSKKEYRTMMFNQTKKAFDWLTNPVNSGRPWSHNSTTSLCLSRSIIAQDRIRGDKAHTKSNIHYFKSLLQSHIGTSMAMSAFADIKPMLDEGISNWK